MSEPKWTPGPWMWWTSCSWRRLGTENQSTLIMQPTNQPSDGHPDLHFPNGGWQGPDAHLIAAAPELYEALMEAWADMELGSELEMKTLAVLAKARGES